MKGMKWNRKGKKDWWEGGERLVLPRKLKEVQFGYTQPHGEKVMD